MKSVIIIADGTTQIALTPDNDWERTVLDQVQKHGGALTILSGRVYECMGNYWRAVDITSDHRRTQESLILRLDAPSEKT